MDICWCVTSWKRGLLSHRAKDLNLIRSWVSNEAHTKIRNLWRAEWGERDRGQFVHLSVKIVEYHREYYTKLILGMELITEMNISILFDF